MRTDIPAKRRFDIECKTLENIVLIYEVTLDKVKWLIFALYRPPSMPNNLFTKNMSTLLDKDIKYYQNLIVIGDLILDKDIKYYQNLIVIGDLNYDMLCTEKSQTLDELCDLLDLTNIIKGPTCNVSRKTAIHH